MSGLIFTTAYEVSIIPRSAFIFKNNTYVALIFSVSSPRKHQHDEIGEEHTCNCHKHRYVARLTKTREICENFVKINRIGFLNEVSTKRRQMIAEAFEMRCVGT